MRWVLSVQRELPGQFVVEGAYVASRSYDLSTDFNRNPVPREYLSTSNVRDTGDDQLPHRHGARIRSPGLLPGETLNGTAQRQQLLRPFPQFQNIDVRRYDGSSRFDSVQGQLRKRFAGGYMFETSYTWSDFKEKVTRLNDTDPDYEERFNDTHLPHRLVVNGIWELPFGKGRRWGGRRQRGRQRPDRQLERVGGMELAVRPAEPGDGERVLRRRHHAAEDEVHRTIPT